MKALAGLASGVLFGIGLALSGMTQPAKVFAFLDVAGAWDPSLAFVMAGAIAVFAPLQRLIFRRNAPILAREFVVVAQRRIDRPLLLGASVFGLGWGLSGYCPGPGVVALGAGTLPAVVFGAGMVAGMLGYRASERTKAARTDAAALADG